MRTFARILMLHQSKCPNYDKDKIGRVGQSLGIRDSSVPFSRWGRASLSAFSTHASSHAGALSAPLATQPFHQCGATSNGRSQSRWEMVSDVQGEWLLISTAKCQPKSAVGTFCWKAVESQRPQLRGMEPAVNTDFFFAKGTKDLLGSRKV